MQTTAGKHVHNTVFDTDSGPVGIDNRCTACISHVIQDFESSPQPTGRTISGFGGTKTSNVFIGTIKWKFADDNGMVHTFRIPNSFYVPNGRVRLLSPQHWAQAQRDGKPIEGTGSETTREVCKLYWKQRRFQLTVPRDKETNVFTFRLAPGYNKYHAFTVIAGKQHDDDDNPIIAAPSIVSDDEAESDDEAKSNDAMDATDPSPPSQTRRVPDRPGTTPMTATPVDFDLDGTGTAAVPTQTPAVIEDDEDTQPTNVAAEFLKYHIRFNHCSPIKIQEMARQGILPKRLATCDVPVCSACQFGKASRRPWRHKTAKNAAKPKQAAQPGDIVSVDQLISPTPGLVAQMSGFLTKDRYTCATVFVDHHSNLGYVHLQKSTSVEHTLEAKAAFERYADQRSVVIRNYHSDNGTFAARGWMDACRAKGQGLTFAAVNAHHQNGKAENRIKNLQDMARTMLIYANKRWPEAVTTNLWPYAVRMANDSINATPWMSRKDRLSPNQIFDRTGVDENPKHWHHFGCPVYVLDGALQQGRRPPGGKWQERARIGLYLGRSPQHSRNVALVLNLTTARVSPQFHVKIDNMFHSVKNATKQERPKSTWQIAAGFVREKASKDASPQAEPNAPTQNEELAEIPRNEATEQQNTATGQVPAQGPPTAERHKAKRATSAKPQSKSNPDNHSDKSQPPKEAQAPEGVERKEPATTLRRSTRTRKLPSKFSDMVMSAELSRQAGSPEIFSLQAMYPEETSQHPAVAYKAMADPDIMYLHQAMREPDAAEFRKAMRKEIDAQIEGGALTLIHKSKIPKGATLLPAVWQMRRKRDIQTRKVYKWKARLNLDGSRMRHKRDYDQTYAPVASWSTIRMLLTMSIIHNWHTVQLDYVLAFTQAPVERELYMKIPKGFEVDGAAPGEYAFKVTKNTYGQKQAGRVWNKYLVQQLESIGFEQSDIDECVFYKGNMVYVLYTDDSILAGPDKAEIDRTIAKMKRILDLTIEGNLNDFLGINIDRRDDEVHLTQPHLIEQIVTDLRLQQGRSKAKDVPMQSSKILARHSDADPFDKAFNYRSVIGKLNYLDKGTRPDIAYAAHQCARFSANPKKPHGDAVRWLGRYLLGTRDKGMVLRPDPTRSLEVHVDADFCGNWDKQDANDPDAARSRHGYVITYAGCPVVWKSQLQTEHALSSTESEYTGLSYALREAIPIMELIKEMRQHGHSMLDHRPKVHCKVFEDNSGALEIATVHKWRPRTKHLAVKLHHFRGYVNRGEISIHKIATEDQPADFLTKPLSWGLLTRHRKTVMGW